MDSAISTAARALAVGDALLALKYVALRSDPAALALRGIAMAQLGELVAARRLLKRAADAFGEAEPLAQARCVVALAEVQLALRDLKSATRGLDVASDVLSRSGDIANAAFARLLQVRQLALLGDVTSAGRALAQLPQLSEPARLVALAKLVEADLALRRADSHAAEEALSLGRAAAIRARIPALLAEVERAEQQLRAPIARLLRRGEERELTLAELPALFGSSDFIVDACRREVRGGQLLLKLAKRPILLELLVALAEAAPAAAARDVLIARVFGARRVNDSHRARLRVEIGRLRKLLGQMAELSATPEGFALSPRHGAVVALLLPPTAGDASEILALLQGGEAWATSALAQAVGRSQRSVQRALSELEQSGLVRAAGAGRSRRWVKAPSAGFATTLLLVAPGALG